MAENTHPEVLYLGPSDSSRTSVADYARSYRDTIGQFKGFMMTPLLSDDAPEWLDGNEEAIGLVKKRTAAALKQCGAVAGQVLHVELGNTTLREYWAAYYAGRLRPETPLCVVFHDPPHLPAQPPPPALDPKSSFIERVLTNVTNQLAEGARARMAAHFLDRASVLLTLSRRGAELLAQQYPLHRHKVACLPPLSIGLIPDDIEPRVRQGTEMVQAVLFGCLRPELGIEQTLHALQLLQKNAQLSGRMHLRICGRVPLETRRSDFLQTVENLIQSLSLGRLVTFAPGVLSERALNQLLMETDILLLPYQKGACEGVSMSLLRAETWGVAPIASDTGSLREFIEDGKDGLLFPVGNTEIFADALLRLMKDQDFRIRLAKARRDRALRERAPAQICSLLLPLYREMLQARNENRPVRFPEAMIVPGILPEEKQKPRETGEADHV